MHRFEDKRINEALELLNGAARDKKTDLQAAMENKYTDLSALVSEFSERVNNGMSKKIAASKQKVAEVASGIDKSVHKNPWPYIGGAAVVALISGFLLGRSRRD